MPQFLPLRPGLWWMRRWHLPGKLATLGVLAIALPALAFAQAPWWTAVAGALVLLYALGALYVSLSTDLAGLSQAMGLATQGDLRAQGGRYGRD